jgi:hypothetical protein
MLLMVSRFGQVELAAARLYPVLHKPCACSNSTTASRQQRAATEQFQPHIMQAFASTPIRMCSVKQILQLLHPSPGCGHAAQTPMQQPQQQPADSRIQKSLQLHSLSSVMPMQASAYACLFLCISLVQQNLQLVPV